MKSTIRTNVHTKHSKQRNRLQDCCLLQRITILTALAACSLTTARAAQTTLPNPDPTISQFVATENEVDQL